MECIGTTIFVDNVEEVLDFYYQAFGISTAYIDEQGTYGELDCGQCVIAFAAHAVAQSHFRQGYIRSHPKQPTLGFELSFECENVPESFARAVEAGAEPHAPPTLIAGQMIAFVRAQEGTLIRLMSTNKK
ncbi:VOC family protein [Pseudoalteromonas sp. SSDWG2]|uniref:VOC family protein n=1 Tax=Pseudoalteromonas sp. SSDWG2 TaxID=3139391 RepID=UPI003BAC474B